LSFHQVFTVENLDKLRFAGAIFCADCNVGTNFTTKKGWYCNLFDLWLVRNGIADLLSFPQLEADGFMVSYHIGGNWIITTPQDKEITFHRKENSVCRGLPYINKHSMNTKAMNQTVRQHYEGYTKCKVQDAIAACKAQAMIGHPTEAQFIEMVRNNTIKNCPIKPDHIANALTIFGPSTARVHGKTVCCKLEQVEAEPGCILDNFHHLHKFVVLTADVMFVKGIAFLITLSQKLWFTTVEELPTCMATQLSNS
jgi:hypothetical protein